MVNQTISKLRISTYQKTLTPGRKLIVKMLLKKPNTYGPTISLKESFSTKQTANVQPINHSPSIKKMMNSIICLSITTMLKVLNKVKAKPSTSLNFCFGLYRSC